MYACKEHNLSSATHKILLSVNPQCCIRNCLQKTQNIKLQMPTNCKIFHRKWSLQITCNFDIQTGSKQQSISSSVTASKFHKPIIKFMSVKITHSLYAHPMYNLSFLSSELFPLHHAFATHSQTRTLTHKPLSLSLSPPSPPP